MLYFLHFWKQYKVAMRGERRYWAAFKKTNVARGNITDYIQYGKFETNFFWYTHMEHGHLLPGNLTEFLLSEPFDGLYLNDCLVKVPNSCDREEPKTLSMLFQNF